MRLDVLFPSRSLKARLISHYLVILGTGGLVTSVVGSWIVSSTIMAEAHRSVAHDLATARSLYDQRLETAKRTVQLVASGGAIQQHLSSGDTKSLLAYLEPIRKDAGFDFLTLTDRTGRVTLRVSRPNGAADDVSSISVVRAALSGKVAAATEILSAQLLTNEDPLLAARAHMRFVTTPRARPPDRIEETSGMVLIAGAPIRGAGDRILGALCGGVLVNRNFGIVDRVWELVFRGYRFDNQDVGSVTIFQNDLRVATTITNFAGERAVGTLSSADVYDRVFGQGQGFRGRAFVVRDWYISAYDPILNYDGKIIGMLYVGLLEKAYTSTRDRVILSFFGLAGIGFIFIIGVTYYEIRKITLPIARMVAATRSIAAGR
ncbi:MAG: cache domain-containing protein, partial [Acidobacteriota bacterium]